MIPTFDVVLPLPPKELGANFKCHWATRSRATRKYRLDCYRAALAARPKGWEGTHPIELDVLYKAFRGCGGYAPKDLTNAIHSLKPAFDGIVDAGVMPSDAKRWLSLGSVNLITTAREAKNCAGVLFRIKQREKQSPY